MVRKIANGISRIRHCIRNDKLMQQTGREEDVEIVVHTKTGNGFSRYLAALKIIRQSPVMDL